MDTERCREVTSTQTLKKLALKLYLDLIVDDQTKGSLQSLRGLKIHLLTSHPHGIIINPKNKNIKIRKK